MRTITQNIRAHGIHLNRYWSTKTSLGSARLIATYLETTSNAYLQNIRKNENIFLRVSWVKLQDFDNGFIIKIACYKQGIIVFPAIPLHCLQFQCMEQSAIWYYQSILRQGTNKQKNLLWLAFEESTGDVKQVSNDIAFLCKRKRSIQFAKPKPFQCIFLEIYVTTSQLGLRSLLPFLFYMIVTTILWMSRPMCFYSIIVFQIGIWVSFVLLCMREMSHKGVNVYAFREHFGEELV